MGRAKTNDELPMNSSRCEIYAFSYNDRLFNSSLLMTNVAKCEQYWTIEGINVTVFVRIAPSIGLHGTTHFESVLVDLQLAVVKKKPLLQHQPAKISVGTNIIEQ